MLSKAEPMTANWIDICALDDLPCEAGVAALIDDEQVAVFRLGDTDEVYITSNLDPFSDSNVLARGILGSIDEELVVASPIYKQHFSLTTGRCLEDEEVSIKTYPVQVVDNRVQIGVSK